MGSSSGCAPRAGVLSWPDAGEKDEHAFPSEAPRPPQRFPRACRLTARRQFLAVYEKGRRVTSVSFVIFGWPNDMGHCRLGLTVTRKTGGAVSRNRIKRLLRELFRQHWKNLTPPLDLVINARSTVLERAPRILEREFLDSFRQLASKVRR